MVKHALLAACALVTGSSCLLPEYAPSGVIQCSDDSPVEPFAKVLDSGNWAQVTDLDGDVCGDMYVLGSFDNNVRFDSSLTFDGDWVDSYIGRMQPNGAYEWVRQIGGSEEQWASRVARVPDGVVVAGRFEIELAFESQVLFAPGVIDQFHGYALKLAADGSLAGQVWLSTSGEVHVEAIAASRDGRLAIGGSFASQLTVEGSGIALSTNTNRDGYVVVFDSQLVPLWHVQVENMNDESVTDLAFADDGRLYVAATSSGEPLWEAYSQGGMAEHGEFQSLDVGGSVDELYVVPLPDNERVYVLHGGQFIDDGTMEWPLNSNFGAMRVSAQGVIQWHFEVPDLEGMEGIVPEVYRVKYDAASGFVHIAGSMAGGQGKIVQGGEVIKTLDPKIEPDVMLVTFHVDTGFRSVGLFGDDTPQYSYAVFGGSGQVLMGGDYDGTIDFPSGNRVATQSPYDGYLVRFPWPGP